MRIHDVEPIGKPSSPMNRYRGPIIFFGIIAVSVGAYVIWSLSQDDEDEEESTTVDIGPLTEAELREQLDQRRFKRSEVVIPFDESDKVKAFARKATHGKAGDQEKAEALMDAIRDFLDENHELYRSISARTSPPLGPEKTLAALQSSDGFQPYSYELAALMVTGCRAVGVPAVLAEVYQFESAERPADASGTHGYYVAALPRGGSSYGRPISFDPASGRSGDNAAGDADVLTDVEAVAAVLSLEALHAATHAGDTTTAERQATLSVRLRPESATAHAARGTVRMAGGGGELSARAALEDYEQAFRRRGDAQRKVLVARILLALQQGARAEELVRSALSDAPEFGAAHGLMGLVHVARRSFDEAQASLTTAERLEPNDPHISLLWVQYYLAQEEIEPAIEAARSVVEQIPDDPQPRLLLARLYWEDARYDTARVQLRELLERHPDNAQLREIIEGVFEIDPDELGEEEPEPEGDAGADTDWDAGFGGDAGGGLRLQMGDGPGRVRLGGEGGFQLSGPRSPMLQ